MPLFPNEIPTAEQSEAMHDRAQGAREVAAAYRQTCDDRDDGTPADPQFPEGNHLRMQAMIEALEAVVKDVSEHNRCTISTMLKVHHALTNAKVQR